MTEKAASVELMCCGGGYIYVYHKSHVSPPPICTVKNLPKKKKLRTMFIVPQHTKFNIAKYFKTSIF
jgi:hypothetical protein